MATSEANNEEDTYIANRIQYWTRPEVMGRAYLDGSTMSNERANYSRPGARGIILDAVEEEKNRRRL